MNKPFEAVKIAENIWWVGAIDWNIRDFHGYGTPRGSTYNAFLVIGEKIALIDTVKAGFKSELMARIGSVIPPNEIDYIISNHSEPDHTGSLAEVIDEVNPERVLASKIGKNTLANYYGIEVEAVDEGMSLDLGGLSLSFLETRMIHWPDSMFSYIPEWKILFAQDAFGMHLASSERFADQLDKSLLKRESDKYYANIVLPYSTMVEKTLDKVAEIGLKIDVICPDHGPIWRGVDVEIILDWYRKYVEGKPFKKAVVLYDTMWGSTDMMARSIGDGLIEAGLTLKVLRLRHSNRAELITELLDAGVFIVGSPTLNNGVFPTVADAITYVKGLKPRNLIGASFGSHGWSGEASGIIQEWLMDMNVEIVEEPLKVRYRPFEDDLVKCREFGKSIAEKLIGRLE